jgi:hypothetical protein
LIRLADCSWLANERHCTPGACSRRGTQKPRHCRWTRRVSVPNRSEHGEGSLIEIDPKILKVRRTVAIPLNPVDVQASDKGLVFVSGGSDQRTNGIIAVVDARDKRAVIAQWSLVSGKSRILLSGDQRWLFISPKVFPVQIEACSIPQNPSDLPTVKRASLTPPEFRWVVISS